MHAHAIVIGGGVAGMLAAKVLTDHFERVTLLERDRLPAEPVFRPGTPQACHLHLFWNHGLEIADGLFPGLKQNLIANGAPELRMPRDALWLTSAGWRRRFDITGLISFSRSLLDWTLREHALSTERIEILEGAEVTGLTASPSGHAVTGVNYRERGSGTRTLSADLVVDAGGHTSHAPEWLAELGRPLPHETTIDPLLGYASRYYAVPDGWHADWKALYIQADPPGSKRAGALFPQEGNRWICTLAGAGRDYPPISDEGFLEFAEGLRHPVLHDTIKNAEPLTPVKSFRRTANRWRHYERIRGWPQGFASIGDATCTFNPLYGQGMTAAALSVLELDRMLRQARSTLWFQKRLKRILAGAWLIATSEDRRYPTTLGPPVRTHTKIMNAYVDRTVLTANDDPGVCGDLLDALALKRRPACLLRPAVVTRILANQWKAPQNGGGEPGPMPRLL
ncbi:FAD-dependent oxidoreductase [Streptomyces sp. NPDC020379]|uniref:FAD-dependent oxidoreductase n=1 Tax=Streptomyces sp. NPDC020379 TaxID=3365071 RepID=UPI00378AE6EF